MSKNFIEIPKDLKKCMQLIIDNGYECYLVGGAVRDYLINADNKDFDLCTNISFNKLKELIPNITIMKENDHRNTAIIRSSGIDIEFSTYRGNNLKEDLYNRDFTINAIAADVSGNIIDYYDGVNSINNKTITLVNPLGTGFINDPLRILRAIRLALKYNFNIDINAKQQMIDKKELLNNVAPERIFEELKKIIVLDDIDKYMNEYKEIFFEIIPELKACDGFNQHNDYHIYDVYTHTINVVKNAPKNIYLRLASIFHDIGKPRAFELDEKQVGHFLGHANISNDIFKRFADKYKLDNKTKKIVSDLVLYHENDLSSKNNKIYNFYKKFNMNRIEMLFDLKIADVMGQNSKYINRIEELKKLKAKYVSIRDKYNSITYSGVDLIALGYTGKVIGLILDDIKRQIINNRLNSDPESINKYVLKNYKVVEWRENNWKINRSEKGEHKLNS